MTSSSTAGMRNPSKEVHARESGDGYAGGRDDTKDKKQDGKRYPCVCGFTRESITSLIISVRLKRRRNTTWRQG